MKFMMLAVILAASACTLSRGEGDKKADSTPPRDPPAAPLFNFNLLVFGDADLVRSATQGRLAASGDVNLADFSVGGVLAEDAQRCDLSVGGDLNFTDGSLAKGAICVAGSLRTTRVGAKFPGKAAPADDIAAFEAAARARWRPTSMR